jgi:hypothetical protein
MGFYPEFHIDKKKCVAVVSNHERWTSYHQCTRNAVEFIDGYGFCRRHYVDARVSGKAWICADGKEMSITGVPGKNIECERDEVLHAEAMAEQRRRDREYWDKQDDRKTRKYANIANQAIARLEALGEDTSWLRSLKLMKPSEVDDAIAESDMNALVGMADKALGIGRVPEVGE